MKVWGYVFALFIGSLAGWIGQQFWSASEHYAQTSGRDASQLERNESRLASLKTDTTPQPQVHKAKPLEAHGVSTLLASGSLDEALELYLSDLEGNAVLVDVREQLVEALLLRQRYDDVLSLLYEQRLFMPQELEIDFLQAVFATVELIDQLLAEQVQTATLVAMYRQLVSQHPDHVPYTLRLAYWLMEQQEFSQAQESLLTAANSAEYQEALFSLSREIEQRQQVHDSPAEVIPLKRIGRHFIAEMELAELGVVNVMLDTGASMSVLKRSVVESLGLDGYDRKDIQMNTANGTILGEQLTLPTIRLAELSLSDVEIGVIPLRDFQHDGLLGMNVLGRFKFYIDQEQAVLYLQ